MVTKGHGGGVILVRWPTAWPTGYLCHPLLAKEYADGSSGNYGTYDQLGGPALGDRNIRSLWRRPCQHHIDGQSDGGGSVKNLVPRR
jgi:para-nitrobenzyl esterase